MRTELIANAVSISFLLALVVPAASFLMTQDFYYVGLIGGIVGANALVMGIKPALTAIVGSAEVLRRPAGAHDCDALCDGGASGGRPGFPSGHMTTVTMCVLGMWLRQPGRGDLVLWLGVPWIAAMAWARWAKQCHNWPQIAGGVVFGGVCAMGLYRAAQLMGA